MATLSNDRHAGMNTLISPEKLPVWVYRRLVNYVLSEHVGQLEKRPRYEKILSGVVVKGMAEIKDKNGSRTLLLSDNGSLKTSVYSSSYGTPSAIGNDNRTAGSTVTDFRPVAEGREIRSGAGIANTTDRPVWFGYLEAQNRYNGLETVPAGQYLDEMDSRKAIEQLFYAFPANQLYPGSNRANVALHALTTTDKGVETGNCVVYAVPVLVDGQKGFPYQVGNISGVGDTSGRKSVEMTFFVAPASSENSPRLKALELYIGFSIASQSGDSSAIPAYLFDRIDLNDDSNSFLEKSATVASGILSFTDIDVWLTFDPVGFWVKDVSAGTYHRITARSGTSPLMALTVSPAASGSGAKQFQFLSRWSLETYFAVPIYQYRTFFDDYYRKMSREMYANINLPVSDDGLDDFRFRYMAIAGKRSIIAGCPDSRIYYSAPYAPDIIPSLNQIQAREEVTGVVDYSESAFLVTYRRSADLITIYGNGGDIRRDDSFLDVGSVGQKALMRIQDGLIALFDYTGPYLVSGIQKIEIGRDLVDYWNAMPDSNKESCVIIHNRLKQLVLFSFPGYNPTGEFTSGIAFVFDLRSFREGKLDWSIQNSDSSIYYGIVAEDLHLITASDSALFDWNAAQTESCSCHAELGIIRNPRFSDRINLDMLTVEHKDGAGGSLNCALYESGVLHSSVSFPTGRKEIILEKSGEEFEFRFSSAKNSQNHEFKSWILDMTPLED